MRKASEAIQELIDQTAGPQLRARVVVDQPYAQDQHETLYYQHPRGGQAKFLEEPLFADHKGWLQDFADTLLGGDSAADNWVEQVGRPLHGVVEENAPIEFGDLKNSAALEVKEGSSVVESIPARQPRLSDWELSGKSYMRDLGLGYR